MNPSLMSDFQEPTLQEQLDAILERRYIQIRLQAIDHLNRQVVAAGGATELANALRPYVDATMRQN